MVPGYAGFIQVVPMLNRECVMKLQGLMPWSEWLLNPPINNIIHDPPAFKCCSSSQRPHGTQREYASAPWLWSDCPCSAPHKMWTISNTEVTNCHARSKSWEPVYITWYPVISPNSNLSHHRKSMKFQLILPSSKSQNWGHRPDSHGGSNSPGHHSKLQPPAGSIPKRSSSFHNRRHSSRYCSRGKCSSCHTPLVVWSGKEEMGPGWAGSGRSWWGMRPPSLSHTCQSQNLRCSAPSECSHPLPSRDPTSSSQSSSQPRSPIHTLQQWHRGPVRSHIYRWIYPARIPSRKLIRARVRLSQVTRRSCSIGIRWCRGVHYRSIQLKSPPTGFNGDAHRLIWNSLLQGFLVIQRNVFIVIDRHNLGVLLQKIYMTSRIRMTVRYS